MKNKYYGWFYADHPDFTELSPREKEYGTLFTAMYKVNKDNSIDLHIERYGSGTLFSDSVIASVKDLQHMYDTAVTRNAGKQGITIKGLRVSPFNFKDHSLHVKFPRHSTAEQDKQAINAIAKAMGFGENYMENSEVCRGDDVVQGIYRWLQCYDDPETAEHYMAVEFLSEELDDNNEYIMEYLPQDYVNYW